MSNDKIVEMKVCGHKDFNEKCEDDVLRNYFREINSYPQLSADEEWELCKQIEEGNQEAKTKLIQSNLKLVITIARKNIHTSGLPMVDLIQEGNLGLMVAVDKFNYKLGYKFSTYAGWWIKQAMFKAISEQSHCMKIPVYIQETLSKYSKTKSQMEQNTNTSVKMEQVAKKINVSPEKIEMFLSAYTKTVSIENGIEKNDGKEINVADILADENTIISANIEYEGLKNDINNIISNLKEREREVVKMRYGLDDCERCTLEEIGNLYGVTKECIRQTELRALKKMKECGRELLECYMF